jgi:hypothetical protein
LSDLVNAVVFVHYPLFSPTGGISATPDGFIVRFAEVEKEGLKYIITGQSPKDDFVYFTFIMEDRREHFSFQTNQEHYRWSPSTCLVLNPVSVVANCVSSIKIISLLSDGLFHNFQFNIEGYLGQTLQQAAKALEHFEVDVIECQDSGSLVILLLGYIFYSENREKWFAGITLLELPVDGRPIKRLHDEIRGYRVRPPGNQIYEDLSDCLQIFRQVPLHRTAMISCLTNETTESIEGIPFADLNLILIRES